MPIWYHATPRGNMGSITREGLRRFYARARMKVVWLHRSERHAWATAHVSELHGVDECDVVIYPVTLSDEEVKAWSTSGIAFVDLDIAPDRLGRPFVLARRVL